jgi:hypothetical protein
VKRRAAALGSRRRLSSLRVRSRLDTGESRRRSGSRGPAHAICYRYAGRKVSDRKSTKKAYNDADVRNSGNISRWLSWRPCRAGVV